MLEILIWPHVSIVQRPWCWVLSRLWAVGDAMIDGMFWWHLENAPRGSWP